MPTVRLFHGLSRPRRQLPTGHVLPVRAAQEVAGLALVFVVRPEPNQERKAMKIEIGTDRVNLHGDDGAIIDLSMSEAARLGRLLVAITTALGDWVAAQ